MSFASIAFVGLGQNRVVIHIDHYISELMRSLEEEIKGNDVCSQGNINYELVTRNVFIIR
jgi:hypothetical protein